MEQMPVNLWLRVVTQLLVLGFMGHLGRLVWIQWWSPARPLERSEMTEREIMQHGQRGMIIDSTGTPLALSQTTYTLRLDPVILSNDAPRFAATVAPWVGMSVEQLGVLASVEANVRRVVLGRVTNEVGGVVTNYGTWTNRSVVIRTGVLPQEWQEIQGRLSQLWKEDESAVNRQIQATVPMKQRARARDAYRMRLRQVRTFGLTAEANEVRQYPNDGLAAHTLGYVTNLLDAHQRPVRELAGAMGIEKQFNEQLKGRSGMLQIHRANQMELTALREQDVKALDGMNVVLSLDLGVQSIAERALVSAMDRLKPKSITALVIRPKTGEILALAVAPGFSPGKMGTGAQTVNHAIRMQYEPGSTFKTFIYAVALETGEARVDESIDSENGRWRRPVGRGKFDTINDDHRLPGMVPLDSAFAHSLNTVAAKLAVRVPAQRLVGELRNFGFGAPTGIPLGGEERGRVKDPAVTTGMYRWDSGTHPRMGFGYTLQVTPMQLAMGLGAIANGGELMEPLLVKRLESRDGTVMREFRPRVVRRVLKPETCAQMTRLMLKAVTDGTGRKAALEEWTVAGKTGTTKKYVPELHSYTTEHYYGSFIGFLPAEDPQLAVVVVVDEPTTKSASYYGGTAAGPVFAEIARGAASYLGIRPSPIGTNSAISASLVAPRPDGGWMAQAREQ